MIKRFLIVSACLTLSSAAHAVYTLSVSTEHLTSAVVSTTFSYNVGSLTNGLLVVGIDVRDTAPAAAPTVNQCTWGGVSLTKSTEGYKANGNSDYRSYIYYLTNPGTGTNDLVVTITAGVSFYMVMSFWNGAHQTQGTVRDQYIAGGGATDPSLVIAPSEDNELIVSHYLSENGNALVVGTDEILLQDNDFGSYVHGGSYAIQTTATSQTVDWTGVDDQWVMAVSSFKQVAAAAGGAPPKWNIITTE